MQRERPTLQTENNSARITIIYILLNHESESVKRRTQVVTHTYSILGDVLSNSRP